MFPDLARREYRIPPWLGWTAATICVVIGAFVTLCFGEPILSRARASNHWPTTDGKIEMSEVGIKTNTDGKILYFTQIRYSYSVGGQRHESKTVWVGDDYFSSSPSSHEETVRHYPLNTKVTVHYDPARPQVAVLEPGLFFSNYGIFITGLSFIGLGLWAAFKTVRERPAGQLHA